MRHRRGSIRIDVADVIGEIDDDELLDEVRDRGLVLAETGEALPIELIQEAHRELLRGRPDEARVILDRLLLPKWKDRDGAQNAYDMFRKTA